MAVLPRNCRTNRDGCGRDFFANLDTVGVLKRSVYFEPKELMGLRLALRQMCNCKT
jgi:hypothetical protein